MSPVHPSTDELDQVVRRVAGVNSLYPAGPLRAKVVTATLGALTHRLPAASVVVRTQGADGVRVTAKIGITADESAGEVSRRVHDAIAAHLRQSGDPAVAEITVIVARIG
ncbi:hypothetical protein [Cryobacterium sp. Y50]|nr:hypothetical protein [Cryobacterium sp. Y50]